MDNKYQVKQYVGEIGTNSELFRVFTTGDPKYYYFAQLNPETKCDTGLAFPVLKTRLRREVGSALRHGWSYYCNSF